MSEDPGELERFYAETVEPLASYDDQYETELVATVEAYLDNDGNVAATAKQLFTHRHTVRYRLERVRELCGHDVSATEGARSSASASRRCASSASPPRRARRWSPARRPARSRAAAKSSGARTRGPARHDSGGRTRTLSSRTKTWRAGRLHHPGSPGRA